MRTKGVPFGYLEFSRAIGRKPCPHARVAAGGGRRPTGAGLSFGFPTRSSSFWTGSHGYGLRGAYPLRHLDPNCPAQRLSANRRG